MNIREKNEKMEMEYLSLYAAKSCESMGRDREEAQCDIRTVYQRDRDRIIHCKAFRRLKHKTQVFLAPMGDHYRTRLTHTLEVSQIARTISKSLDLNEDLTEKNIKCENAGKHMLQSSDADSRFTIESNIEMLGNYNMDRKTDCLSAIAGTRGSLIDTFGNGPKLLRDNFTISVLTRRGKDDNTLIAYKKNITGFTLEEDYSEIINVIKPYATVTDEEGNESPIYIDEIGVKSSRYVEGDIVKSQWIDFSDKFDEDETPTKEKLKNLAEKYFNDNSCDLPKMTYKIEFQPLNKTEEYKEDGLAELEHIGMDDNVYIANSKYKIRDQARVIKTTYNVLTEKYISIELGDPKTTLGSIINKSNNSTVTKDEVKDLINKNNKKL